VAKLFMQALAPIADAASEFMKNKFKDLATACKCPKDIPICVCGGVKKFEIITKKPIIPIDDELKNNNRAHSSKLRILERILD